LELSAITFQTVKALSVIIGLYFLVMAVFATLCSKLGELLNRTKPLTGYSVNVTGSLCGVGTVSFLCWRLDLLEGKTNS